jgi:lysophospholipase L1-like esterase
MSEFETRSIDQLPVASSVSPNALIAFQEPGGPLMRLAMSQLIGRLISTEEATETEEDLQELLDYDEHSIALVFADPSPELNGWYRKAGASGVGNWAQFEKLSAYAAQEVQALVEQAEGSALAAELARDQAAALVTPDNIFIDQTVGAAEALIAVGMVFKLVSTATGLVEVRKRTETGSVVLFFEATTAALASVMGASMVGKSGGGTLQDVIDSLGTVASQNADNLEVNVSKMRRPGFYNFKATSLVRWSSALAAHRAGISRAYIACIGDSTTRGVGSNPAPDSADIDILRNSWPSVMAKAFNQMPGIKATAESVWGDGMFGLGDSQDITAADPRVSFEPGWTTSLPSIGNQFVLGGNAFHDPAGNAGSPRFDFAASVSTDSARAVFVRFPGYADAVISSDAVHFAGPGITTGPDGIVIVDVTRTVPEAPAWTGTETEFFELPWTVQKEAVDSDFNLTLVGFEAYNAADKPIGIYNMGGSGTTPAIWVADNQAYSFINAIQALDIDLHIICHTINPWAQNVPEATYKAQMRTMIEACLVKGDVLLMVGVPSNIGTAPIERQVAYSRYVRDLADEYDLPALDLREMWISQTFRPELGRYYDGLHPSKKGYSQKGYLLATILANPEAFYG